MPQLTFPISPDGLALTVQIGLPGATLQAMQAAGQPLPPGISVRAPIDTRADATSVAPSVLARLGVMPFSQRNMSTASGSVTVNAYEISVGILGAAGASGPTLVRPLWRVTDFIQPLPRIEALLGMDRVREIILTIDGPGGAFTPTF